jgi:hypothetical protein
MNWHLEALAKSSGQTVRFGPSCDGLGPSAEPASEPDHRDGRVTVPGRPQQLGWQPAARPGSVKTVADVNHESFRGHDFGA